MVYTLPFTEMYAEVALRQLFIKEGDIELPHPVEEMQDLKRKRKVLLSDLEVCFS